MIVSSGSALYGVLAADSDLVTLLGGTSGMECRVYQSMVPQDTPMPYVIFQRLAGEELNESPTRSREEVWMVVGIATTLAAAGSLDAACYAALAARSAGTVDLSVTGWTTYSLERESDISYVEPEEGGETYYHEGGLYRLRMVDP